MKWRAMKSAPKDGTRILAYVPSGPGEPSVFEVWWEPDYVEDELGVTFGGWDDDFDCNHAPSAWMPMPEPPHDSKEAPE